MSTGEKAEITIEPEWAYGKKGIEGKYPFHIAAHKEPNCTEWKVTEERNILYYFVIGCSPRFAYFGFFVIARNSSCGKVMFIMSIGKGRGVVGGVSIPDTCPLLCTHPPPGYSPPGHTHLYPLWYTHSPAGIPLSPLGLLSPSPLGYPPPGILTPLVIPTPCYWHLVAATENSY